MPAVLLFLRTQLRVLDIPGKLGILSLDPLVVLLWSGRGPLVWGHYSFAGERLMSSIALAGDGLVLFGRCIVCSHSRTGGSGGYSGTGFGGRGPSI